MSGQVSAHLEAVSERARQAQARAALARRTQRLLTALALVMVAGLVASLTFWSRSERSQGMLAERNVELADRNLELEAMVRATALQNVRKAALAGDTRASVRILDRIAPAHRGLAWRWLQTEKNLLQPASRFREVDGRIPFCFDRCALTNEYLDVWHVDDTSTVYVFRPVGDGEAFELEDVTRMRLPHRLRMARFTPDGQRVLTAVDDDSGTLEIRDVDSHEVLAASAFGGPVGSPLIAPLDITPGWTSAADFAPDGRLAVGGEDGSLRLFDGTDLRPLDELAAFPNAGAPLSRLEFSPDGSMLFVGDDAGRARVVDPDDGTVFHDFVHERHAPTRTICDASFHPDGTQLLVTGWGGQVTLWDLRRSRLIRKLEAHSPSLLSTDCGYTAQFSPSGCYAVTSGRHETARVYETSSWRTLTALRRTNVAHFGASDAIIQAYGPSDSILRWDLNDLSRPLQQSDDRGVPSVRISPDGRFAYSVTHRATGEYADLGRAATSVRAWRLQDGAQIFARRLEGLEPARIDVDATGTRLAIARGAGQISILNAQTGDEVSTTSLPAGSIPLTAAGFEPLSVGCIRFAPAPHAQLLAVILGGSDYLDPHQEAPVFLLDTRTGEVRHILRGHRRAVEAVAFRADGMQLVTGGISTGLILWDVRTGRKVWRTQLQTRAVAFCPWTDALTVGNNVSVR